MKERCKLCGQVKSRPRVRLKHGLTVRQWEYAEAFSRGLTRAQVADAFCVTLSTVDNISGKINREWGTRTYREIGSKARRIKTRGMEVTNG